MSNDNHDSHHEPISDNRRTAHSKAAAPTDRRTWRSEELFGSEREIFILHRDEVYRLRRTRNEKLILQK